MHVRVVTGARKELVTKESDTEFYIEVREKAERNQANKRIREIVSRELAVPLAQVHLLTGHHSSSKIYVVRE